MDKASQSPIRLTRNQEVGPGKNKLDSARRASTGTPSTGHNFGLSIGSEKTKVAYSYGTEISVGIEFETNFLLELFK